MNDQEWLNTADSAEDYHEKLSFLKAQARYNKRNKLRYTCPTCKTPKALSSYEHSHGYHCVACTRNAESNF